MKKGEAAADGVQPRMPERTAADDVGAGYAHVRVHSVERATFEEDVLAEVRPNHAPSGLIANVVHAAVDHREVDDAVGRVVVRTHADRCFRGTDVLCAEAKQFRSVTLAQLLTARNPE